MDQANRELEALLDFYLASGIDCLLEADPVDRFAETARLAERRAAEQGFRPPDRPVQGAGQAAVQSPLSRMPGPDRIFPQTAPAAPVPQQGSETSVVLPNASAVESARDAARSISTLDELRACLEGFEGCNLRLTAKNLVFADGNPEARVMFVGEAPGRDEDLQGKPFVGRSGQLLDKMLKAIGLDRSGAYIANVVPWRPPGNRTPTPQETEICKPFILRQIELVNPDILVFLGSASAKTLLGTQEGIRKLRGHWMKFSTGSAEISCVATYHPAYLLRSPLEKRQTWQDFLSIKQKLVENRMNQT
ncbi:uracil-DNA glycosylase family protein [uncultured Roseibium sp.]|uniref:uracil-DNA glycosylase n=1 Tax=uncultured Roseibium sp. TaxID=1936171 RepID=UPI00374CE9F2